MATYNFTVRARDELGAFADREFNIEVKNTLVDRILAINENHGYASIDGKTWTERSGVGGIWCDNLLGKWIVATSSTTYRISDDTLNWENNLRFRLANQPPVIDQDENGEDVIVEEAGPLHGLSFSFNPKKFTEISGKIYVTARIDNRVGLVYTSNLIDWYLVVSDDYDSEHNNYFGISGTYNTTNNITDWSNVEMHNGQYVLHNAQSRTFIVSNDLNSFSIIRPNNSSSLIEITSNTPIKNNIHLQSLNGVLFIAYLSQVGWRSASNSSYQYRSRNTVYTTIDLNNIIIPETNNGMTSTTVRVVNSRAQPEATTVIYNNGTLALFNANAYTRMDRPTKCHFRTNGVYHTGAVSFEGEILVASSNGIATINVAAGSLPVDKETTGLPGNIVSIGAM